uniref:Prostaglandin E2 receptor EP2 subtype-like n=1 Tax=Crassostrea virginica TaxID=6565 RepID=A0A8B8EZC7_CRAVI|nr:prostaglandin E2 receptor EP2 subtype-like [Crassostrea virginica]
MFTALVITDFLGVFCTYPFAITRYISDFTYCFSTWECQFISFAMVAAHLAAAMLICAMSVDRMLILIRPERLYHPPPGYKYSAVILIIGLLSSVVAMLPLIGFGSVELFHPGSWCYFNFLKTDFAHLFMSYLFSILTFVVIIVTLISNIVTICRLCFRPVSRETLMDSNRVSGYLDNHVMAFIVTVTVSFVATCTPFFVDIFLHATGLRSDNGPLEMWFERLTFLNAIIDPWIYIILRRESIQKLTTLFSCSQNPTTQEEDYLLADSARH